MEARCAGFEERHVVMIGGAAEKGDDVLRAIRKLEAEDPGVKIYLAVDVGREEEHVAEPTGRHREVAGRRAPDGLARGVAGTVEGGGRLGGPEGGAVSSRTLRRLPSGSRSQRPPSGVCRGGSTSVTPACRIASCVRTKSSPVAPKQRWWSRLRAPS